MRARSSSKDAQDHASPVASSEPVARITRNRVNHLLIARAKLRLLL